MSNHPSLMFAPALEQLLTADTWEKKRRVLEEQQGLLLTDDAIGFIDWLMRQHGLGQRWDEQRNQIYALLLYLGLLREARLKGIRQAWAEFKMNISETWPG